MNRSRKLSQTLWHCRYHIVWAPKYHYRILAGKIADLTKHCIRAFSQQLRSKIIELNVQADHVHLFTMVQPKAVSIRIRWYHQGQNSDLSVEPIP